MRGTGPFPEAQRWTREQLNALADAYFESFEPEAIVAPIERDCDRWENGWRTTAGDCRIRAMVTAPGSDRTGWEDPEQAQG